MRESTSRPMSDEDYVARGPYASSCPFCKKDEDATQWGEPFFSNDGVPKQPARCPLCGVEWNEIYGLVGYEIVRGKP